MNFTDQVQRIAEIYRLTIQEAIQKRSEICVLSFQQEKNDACVLTGANKTARIDNQLQWKLIESIFNKFLFSLQINNIPDSNIQENSYTILLSLNRVLPLPPIAFPLSTAASSLEQALIADLKNQVFTDLIINCQPKDAKEAERVCGAHSLILKMRSIVFQNMLKIDMKEKKEGVITLSSCSKPSAEAFIRFLYDLDNPFEKSNAADLDVIEILKLANMYQPKLPPKK